MGKLSIIVVQTIEFISWVYKSVHALIGYINHRLIRELSLSC